MSRFHPVVPLMLVAGLLPSGFAHAQPVPEPERIQLNEAFSGPESAHYDERSRTWFVSSVGGAEPGDGYISRLDADAEIIDEFFADDLDDPKGLAILGGRLYVADVTRVVAIELRRPENRQVFPVEGAVFLNDVAADSQRRRVYISDSFANVIYQLDQDGALTRLVEGAALEAPNGLWVERNELLIATIGPDLDPATFTTSAPGRVLRYDLRRKQLTPASERFGLLDGIVPLDARRYLVSDFQIGVYVWTPGDSPTLIVPVEDTGLTSTADIGFDRQHRRLLIPDVIGVGVALYDFSPDRCR
jgi:hypothetical protein